MKRKKVINNTTFAVNFSLHICERLSVMHEPAGVVENLVQNSTVYPYSAIQNTPPPKKMKIVRNLGTLTFPL